MDQLARFVTSCGFGLAVAAPVGPMALLCMRRTLATGWRSGMATGAGIAVGDGLYASIAALGLASVSGFVAAHEQVLHAAAGVFLLYLGLKTFAPASGISGNQDSGGVKASNLAAFAGSVLLTLTNPPTIIMFAAIFAALAPKSGFDTTTALVTVSGVFCGSLFWWCALTAVVACFRYAIGAKARRRIDLVAGIMLTGFGLIELRRAL